MVFLPIDLIENIVKNSVEPITINSPTHSNRFKILSKFCTLDSNFKFYSSILLQSYVVLTTDEEEDLFYEAFKDKPNPHTRILILESGGRLNSETRGSLALRCVPNLQELSAVSINFGMDILQPLQLLKTLHLSSSNIFGNPNSPVNFSLPSLKHLQCQGVGFLNSTSQFLSPAFLPSLTAISLHRISANSLPDLDRAFISIAPQLEALSTDATYVYSIVLEKATSLLLVDISSRWEVEEIFDSITPALRFIRVHHNNSSHSLENMLNAILARKIAGELGVEGVLADGDGTHEKNSAMVEVEREMELVGIKLKKGTNRGGSGIGWWQEVDDMEQILMKERGTAY